MKRSFLSAALILGLSTLAAAQTTPVKAVSERQQTVSVIRDTVQATKEVTPAQKSKSPSKKTPAAKEAVAPVKLKLPVLPADSSAVPPKGKDE